jgi:hypothetical protein
MISKTGIEVQISPSIHNAKCQSNHLTDAPSIQNVQAVFKENEQVKCRVLHIDDDETVFSLLKHLIRTNTNFCTDIHYQ